MNDLQKRERSYETYLPNFDTHIFYWLQHIKVRIIFKL
jgi:hypothetical protein